VKSSVVGLITGVLILTVGTVIAFAVARTSFVHETSMIAVAVVSVIGGYVASRTNAKATVPGSPASITASMVAGVLAGLGSLLVIYYLVFVIVAVSFAHSQFVW
jgi:hypothetical protein